MNEKITILGSYTVYTGIGTLSWLSKLVKLNNYSGFVVITDSFLEKIWLKKIENFLPARNALSKAMAGGPVNFKKIIIPPGEQTKNIDTVVTIWKQLLLKKCDRKTLVINFGGGVVLDIGGFAASTFMRGLDFINIPTTLLSQVDSALGGKTGIDFAGIKNLIGTFNQPKAVICDINFLSTLPNREFVTGFAEIIKHGLIADQKYFHFVTSKKPKDFSKQELLKIIVNSIKIKSEIISSDEKEADQRKLLNFGHTIGHAVESLSLETTKPLLHGEAIGIGIAAEAKISSLLKMLSRQDLQCIQQSLINAGLPVSVTNMGIDKIIKKMQSDKKNEDGKINFTLLQQIGKAIINQHVTDNIIKQALEQITT